MKFLNLGSKIKKTMLCVFFSSYVLRNERKESSTTQTSFLMLQAKRANSSARLGLSSIKLSKEAKGALSLSVSNSRKL